MRRFAIMTCVLSLTACAAFRGNTRKEFGAYDIEDRQQYKHYLDNKAVRKRDRDREIVNSVNSPKTGIPRQASGNIEGDEPSANAPKATPNADSKTDVKKEYSLPARIIRRLFRLEE